jgi:hypothetical protein
MVFQKVKKNQRFKTKGKNGRETDKRERVERESDIRQNGYKRDRRGRSQKRERQRQKRKEKKLRRKRQKENI